MNIKRVTATDVAREVGVSRATVGFVMNETPGQSISASVRARVLSAASRMGYVPSPHARALALGQSQIVLVLLPEFPVEHLLRHVIDEASAVLDESGYALVTMEPHLSGRTRPLWETLRPDVVMPIERLDSRTEDAIRRSGSTLLLPANADGHSLDIGPDLQVQHLIDRGCRSLAYASTLVGGMAGLDSARRARAADRAAAAGIPLVTCDVNRANAGSVVADLVQGGIDGVACFNDDVAALVVGEAIRQKIDVPDRLRVIGHDDSPIATLMVPSLSSVRIDAAGLGRYLAERALAVARDQATPCPTLPDVRTEVVSREST